MRQPIKLWGWLFFKNDLPTCPDTKTRLQLVKIFDEGNHEEFIKEFISHIRKYWLFHINMWNILSKLDQILESWYKDQVEIYFLKWYIYECNFFVEKSLEMYQKALEIDPTHEKSYKQICHRLVRNGNISQAKVFYEKALKFCSNLDLDSGFWANMRYEFTPESE